MKQTQALCLTKVAMSDKQRADDETGLNNISVLSSE